MTEMEAPENGIATIIVDAAFRVHTTLGPGLLESVYVAVLAYEVEKRGLTVDRQVPIRSTRSNSSPISALPGSASASSSTSVPHS